MLYLMVALVTLQRGVQSHHLTDCGHLPATMLGTFKLQTSEGFEDFMSELGVRWISRKVVDSGEGTGNTSTLLAGCLPAFADRKHHPRR